MTLEQVKAKKPTLDFDPRYGSDHRLLDDVDVRRDDLQGDGGAEPTGAAGRHPAEPDAEPESEQERPMSARVVEEPVVRRSRPWW